MRKTNAKRFDEYSSFYCDKAGRDSLCDSPVRRRLLPKLCRLSSMFGAVRSRGCPPKLQPTSSCQSTSLLLASSRPRGSVFACRPRQCLVRPNRAPSLLAPACPGQRPSCPQAVLPRLLTIVTPTTLASVRPVSPVSIAWWWGNWVATIRSRRRGRGGPTTVWIGWVRRRGAAVALSPATTALLSWVPRRRIAHPKAGMPGRWGNPGRWRRRDSRKAISHVAAVRRIERRPIWGLMVRPRAVVYGRLPSAAVPVVGSIAVVCEGCAAEAPARV